MALRVIQAIGHTADVYVDAGRRQLETVARIDVLSTPLELMSFLKYKVNYFFFFFIV